MRARSALFTLFGDVIRPEGGEAWLATITACMGTLGFSPQATRTALHRMSAEGWVAPRRLGRNAAYRMTPRGVDRLEEAATRIYRLQSAEWDRRWRLVICPRLRRLEAASRELGWIGFGQLTLDTWVSPHDHSFQVAMLLEQAGLTAEAHALTTEACEGDSVRIVADAWDLSELEAAHSRFISQWSRPPRPMDGPEAFRTRMQLVHHWRSFLFLDPGLPLALLPAQWQGERAADLFAERYEALAEPSWAFYRQLVADSPHPPAAVPEGAMS